MPPRKRVRMCKKAPTESGESSMESLPDAILQHILGFLPAQNAVRTCVLARRWRDLWTLATGLRITASVDDEMDVLREFVDHLLLLRGVAPLETCELRLRDIADRFSFDDHLRVNLWFWHAVRRQAQVVRLVMQSSETESIMFYLEDVRPISPHLRELELVGVALRESSLNFSDCPALQQLEIGDCDLSLVKKVSSESLKHLRVTVCVFSDSFRTCIHAPSLVSLLLDDNSYNTPVLESMPSLVDASIRIVKTNVDNCHNCDLGDCSSCHDIIHSNSSCTLLEGLSKTTNLALRAESKTFIFKMDLKWCPTFSKLKTLLLGDYRCVALDLDAITCILKNSPLLEKLTLELFSKGSHHKMEMKGSYFPVQKTDAISEHLKIIEVKCDVVDEKVYKVLKLLSTFNICFSFE